MGSVKAIVRNGQIELIEPVDWPDGTRVEVTPLDSALHRVSAERWSREGPPRAHLDLAVALPPRAGNNGHANGNGGPGSPAAFRSAHSDH